MSIVLANTTIAVYRADPSALGEDMADPWLADDFDASGYGTLIATAVQACLGSISAAAASDGNGGKVTISAKLTCDTLDVRQWDKIVNLADGIVWFVQGATQRPTFAGGALTHTSVWLVRVEGETTTV